MALIKPFWTYTPEYALFVVSDEQPDGVCVTGEVRSRDALADELEAHMYRARQYGWTLLKYKRGHYAIYDDVKFEIWEL